MTFKCPKCGAQEKFYLSGAILTYKYTLNADEESLAEHCTDEDWDYAEVECSECGHTGGITEFRRQGE